MKKLIALLLALLMLGSVAFAETTEDVANYEEQDVLDFTITMDAIPEGYTMTLVEYEFGPVAIFTSDASDVQYEVNVVYSELFDGYTMDLEALTEDEEAEMREMLSAGYSMPSFTFDKTSHGTDVIIIDEQDADSDYGEIFSIYEGYMITMVVMKNDTLTDEDYALGLQILSDMWFVAKE